MSKLRPETEKNEGALPVLKGATAYYSILCAVRDQPGLAHGHLHTAKGQHCAIGSLWKANPKVALPITLIDEVAAVNDASPKATARARKARVLKWLKWKLKKEGMEL